MFEKRLGKNFSLCIWDWWETSSLDPRKNVEVSIISNDTSEAKIEVVEGPDEGLVGALNADGLIKAGENNIEFKNNTLTVNGVVIASEKYKSFIKGSEMSIKISQSETKK